MAGHSKWANIKHKKGAADKKKGKLFSKLAKEIMVAAREGGSDPETNPRLRTALASAKSANMPNDNIDRAIKKGIGEIEGVSFEEILYEGYGPGGVAILVECLTDNRNRTAGEIRMIFDRTNGNLAGSGSVTWMFKRKSRFVITGENADEDRLFEVVVDAGAEDIQIDGEIAEILGSPENFDAISKALENAGIETVESGLVQHPENMVEIKDTSTAKQVFHLVDKLEDNDDVQNVYANPDIPAEIIEEISD